MRICVIVPSQAALIQAGVRIRYERLQSHLSTLGITLSIQVLDQRLDKPAADFDIFVFSKCYDIRAQILAKALSAAGKFVGADYFDDYFSQTSDSRFEKQRQSLRLMSRLCDFSLCSTPRMLNALSAHGQFRAVHVLNDPYNVLDQHELASCLSQKMDSAHQRSMVEIAWFGMGDNPFFSVGLDDLAAMGDALNRIHGVRSHLTILTNTRALNVARLEMLRRLSVEFTIEEWTEKCERDLLERCFACFLPVNGQQFSIAKSLNRAVTALSAGVQVLSAGYPLYRAFEAFIYRSPSRLIADFEKKSMSLNAGNAQQLIAVLMQEASPVIEAERLAKFLSSVLEHGASARLQSAETKPQAVLHGKRSAQHNHKPVQKLGHFSIGTPFSSRGLNYDIQFIQSAGRNGLDVLIGAKALSHLVPEKHALLSDGTLQTGRPVKVLRSLKMPYFSQGDVVLEGRLNTLSSYQRLMLSLRAKTQELFPGVEVMPSEDEPSLLAAGHQGFSDESAVCATGAA
jgi:hypothetical protein